MTHLPGQQRTYSAINAALLALAGALLLQPLFVGSLFFVRSHTDLEAVRRNIATAYQRGVLGVNEVPYRLIHRYGHQFTECKALQISLDDETNLLKVVIAPRFHSLYGDPCRDLQLSAMSVETGERVEYPGYWHGYRIYIWPMLEHLSLAAMRFANAALVLATLVYFYRSFRMAIGPTPAGVLVLVLVCLTDIWRIWRITPHFLPMIVILGGAGLFARAYARQLNAMLAIVLAALLGAVFNFVDFLVNPPMFPLLLSFTVLAVEAPRRAYDSRRQILDALRLPGLIAASWFGGYLLTWVSKWLLSIAWAQDPGQMAQAIVRQILLRLYGQEVDNRVLIFPLLPTARMILQSFIAIGVIPFAVLVSAIFVHIYRHREVFDRRRFLCLITPTLIPIAWFEALSNHTQTHSHFTYRSEVAAIAVMLAAAVLSLAKQPTLGALLRGLRRTSFPTQAADVAPALAQDGTKASRPVEVL